MFRARKHPRHTSGPRKGQFMAKGGKKKGTKKPAKKKAAPRKSSKRAKGTILVTAAKLKAAGIQIPDGKLAFFDGEKNLRVSKRLGGGKRGKRRNCRRVCKS